jgi:hypothetical protein
MKRIKYFIGLILILFFLLNIYVLLSADYVDLDSITNTITCKSKLTSTNSNTLENGVEILPYYIAFDDFQNSLCIGKIKEVGNAIYIYENIFIFNFLKLCYFLTSLVFFKLLKINFKIIFILNLFYYLIFYLNFSFDFLYQTNKKMFSYELIFFEVVLLTFLSYKKIGDFFNKSLSINFFDRISKLVNKYYNLFISIYIFRVLYLFYNNEELRNGVFREWYISYKYGFIKRGFIGEFARVFIENELISYKNFTIILIIIIYTVLFKLLEQYLVNINSLIFIAIFTSPVFVLFNINLISTVVLPKELLGIISLLFLNKYKNSNLKNWGYLIYIISVLSHEVNMIFSIPLFFLLKRKMDRTFFSILNILLIMLIFNFGSNVENIKFICEENEIFSNSCYKSLAISSSPIVHFEYAQQIINFDYIIIYFIYFLFGLSPFLLSKPNYKQLKIFFFCIIIIFSLAVVTVDWGRWLFILFSIVYIQLLAENKQPMSVNITYNKIFLIVTFNLLWKVPHWGVGENFYDSIVRIDKFSFVLIFYIIIGTYIETKSTREIRY